MGHIDDIANDYVDEWAPLDPLGATYVGISGYDDLLTDMSPAGFAALADLDRRTLAALDRRDAGHRARTRREGGDAGAARRWPWRATTPARPPAS